MTETLDQQAVQKLAITLMRSVRDHYLERPRSKATAQEALNALAITAAFILAAARDEYAATPHEEPPP